ncbi:MAG: hypothetical protein BWY52_01447 [Chloroflexi bacterium ADurb.Bin325]|nr:MAG: hypothetical protein BWY52_01447 [Chloroflexi bacterium ADurb.Bin325]
MAKNGLDEDMGLDGIGFDDEADEELYTELDDDRRAELEEMVSLKVLGLELWEESLGDDVDAEPVKSEDRVFFDCDLYLDDHQALELYVVSVYPNAQEEPVTGVDAIFETVGRLSDEGMELIDYGEADDEGGLALAFGKNDQVELVLVCGAWMVSDWEPEEEAEA